MVSWWYFFNMCCIFSFRIEILFCNDCVEDELFVRFIILFKFFFICWCWFLSWFIRLFWDVKEVVSIWILFVMLLIFKVRLVVFDIFDNLWYLFIIWWMYIWSIDRLLLRFVVDGDCWVMFRSCLIIVVWVFIVLFCCWICCWR